MLFNLFNLSYVGEIFCIESERTVSEFRKDKETFCFVFTYSVKRAHEISKFHVAVVQRWLKNVQKSVMHVQSCCFTFINLLFFLPFSLPSPSLLSKHPFAVIQKVCYHGNVTSHFPSLFFSNL